MTNIFIRGGHRSTRTSPPTAKQPKLPCTHSGPRNGAIEHSPNTQTRHKNKRRQQQKRSDCVQRTARRRSRGALHRCHGTQASQNRSISRTQPCALVSRTRPCIHLDQNKNRTSSAVQTKTARSWCRHLTSTNPRRLTGHGPETVPYLALSCTPNLQPPQPPRTLVDAKSMFSSKSTKMLPLLQKALVRL